MGKVYHNVECCKCHETTTCLEVFGKLYCKPCADKKPKRGHGHSGMLRGTKELLTFAFDEGLVIERTNKGDKTYATIFLDHYPGSKGVLGRQLHYFVKFSGVIIGIIGFNSPPRKYKKFEHFFGENKEIFYLNNNVFCMITHNLICTSQILSVAIKQVKKDYRQRYGDKLIGLVTFVEPPRKGILYKAANWVYLGMTQGKKCSRRGDLYKWINKEWGEGTKKHIFALSFLRKKYQARDTLGLSNQEGEGRFLDSALEKRQSDGRRPY